MHKLLLLLLVAFFVFSCQGRKTSSGDTEKPAHAETSAENENTEWEQIRSAIVTLESYDGDRILESGQGFFVADSLIITKYSLVSSATRVVFSPLNSTQKFTASRYVAIDRINDVVVLQSDSLQRKPIDLFDGIAPNSAKTSYISPASDKTIQLFTGKVLNLAVVKGTRVYRITNRVRKSNFGMPVFVSTRQAVGMAYSAIASYEMQSFAVPSTVISKLISNRQAAASLASLNARSNAAISAENKKIKGLVLETDAGDITIRLFNETPEYRDNFIKLAKEHYFDSLLIHRVISNFGIQSGAADTRYARKGDIVGYKGPGYTLPAHIVPGLYHKRGSIGSPRKPDTENERLRSDGSQFYIVSGRKYFDNELDDLEKENDYTFSPEQRQAYKTGGGAPHLDGSYTIFGEVVSGMEVVDKIVQVETDRQWRPLKDIRLIRVRILK